MSLQIKQILTIAEKCFSSPSLVSSGAIKKSLLGGSINQKKIFEMYVKVEAAWIISPNQAATVQGALC